MIEERIKQILLHQTDSELSESDRLRLLSLDVDWLIERLRQFLAAFRELEIQLGLVPSSPRMTVLPGGLND